MDFTVYKNKLPMSGHEVMQRFGYGHLVSHRTGKESYAKRIYRENYPRFHVYLKEVEDKLIFSLHIDQKEASYQGQRSHSGEYDGPLVEQEINRLKQFIVSLVTEEAQSLKLKAQMPDNLEIKSWWKFW